jgi:hypothetical protein
VNAVWAIVCVTASAVAIYFSICAKRDARKAHTYRREAKYWAGVARNVPTSQLEEPVTTGHRVQLAP